MLERHVEHMFPLSVMEAYKASLSAEPCSDADEHEPLPATVQEEESPVPPTSRRVRVRRTASGRGRSQPAPMQEEESSAPSGASPAVGRAHTSSRRDRSQPAHKKSKPNEVAPKTKHILMPPSGVKTILSEDCQGFFTRACNYYRQAVPDEYANHAFFASAMKVDQTFARFVATRMRRREAFLKKIFGESWEMVDESHPVDMPMAESALRCDLAMRFAVYNELEYKLARDKAASAHGSKHGVDDGQDPGDIASGSKRVVGKESEFEWVLKKMLYFAEQNEENTVAYNCDAFKARSNYKGADGWCNFLAQAHGHQLVDKIFSEEANGLVPAIQAILNGEVGRVKTTGGKNKGPSFVLDVAKVKAWLASEGGTQPGDVNAVPQEDP